MSLQELKEWRSKEAKPELAKKLRLLSWIITVVVLGLVTCMRKYKIPLPDGWSFSFLPPIHATVNALAAVVLVLAIVAIRQGKVALHRKYMLAAMGLSVLFLISYVLYHFTTPETLYGDIDKNGKVSAEEAAQVGILRSIYLSLLLPHIALAAVSFPFILLTLVNALTNQFDRHRKMARRVFPLWLFVAVSGPICYLMLRPYY